MTEISKNQENPEHMFDRLKKRIDSKDMSETSLPTLSQAILTLEQKINQ
jgi:hypothetical protein